MIAERSRSRRSPERMAESLWRATMARVRGEFAEMPCMRVTPGQACALFGVHASAINRILDRLVEEGFLTRTPRGEYVRRRQTP
jgi:DNA-binding MarR family transcriptional regulator